MTKICGLDEAGRGPVIGPMVICGALIDESKESILSDLGVKDSKQISPKKRGELSALLDDHLDSYKLIEIKAKDIDSLRALGTNLNHIEFKGMAAIIDALQPDKTFIDAPEAKTENVSKHIETYLTYKNSELIPEHKADQKYPIVSAASILAKVKRDERIAEIAQDYGEIGSGYPSDPTTQKFLKEWLRQNDHWPDIVRQSWATAQQLMSTVKGASQQKSLGDY